MGREPLFLYTIHHYVYASDQPSPKNTVRTIHEQKAKDVDLTPWAKALPEQFVAILLDKDGMREEWEFIQTQNLFL